MSRSLVIDAFCRRQFSPTYIGTRLVGIVESELEAFINKHVDSKGPLEASLVAGYAPFCKHVFVPLGDADFPSIKTGVLEITKENEHLVRCGYEARTEKELATLVTWIPVESVGGFDKLPKAKYLDVILYSREQIRKENAAMGVPSEDTNAPWGIISVKAQGTPNELPMTPMTMMRNALGKEEGGSGVPLDRAAYNESVAYWSKHVVVR